LHKKVIYLTNVIGSKKRYNNRINDEGAVKYFIDPFSIENKMTLNIFFVVLMSMFGTFLYPEKCC
jgi:hypothetical protein